MSDLLQREEALLFKYKDGRDLDFEDGPLVAEMREMGLMRCGMSLKRKVVTAKATSLGLKLVL